MVDITFTEDMRQILKSLVGQRLVSLECERLDRTQETYGNLLITTESQKVELINEEEPTEYFGEVEDISRFICRRLEPNEEFRQFITGTRPMKYPLLGKVNTVSIVNDHVSMPEKQYDIQLSMAVILDTDAGETAFLRGWHFDEMITIVRKSDYRSSLRSVAQVQSDWSDDPSSVTVERTLIEL
ncbi:hypothetical protein [Bifidobacterium stellenboschense]|uniref:Uncharacterized protein n=1 Tax=Bifidobacterium stellenboschense TaxID=762211 RepID=A0A087DGE9_9BIFI|nr:hypothetical protein [Bifidobacterium stellenboschense]KFI94599.1 hypothetical protein BSTEL_1269 [Bifidobacterium stellenboschense]